MYKPIDLLKYEVYVQTDRPHKHTRSMYKPTDLLKYEVYVQNDRPVKI